MRPLDFPPAQVGGCDGLPSSSKSASGSRSSPFTRPNAALELKHLSTSRTSRIDRAVRPASLYLFLNIKNDHLHHPHHLHHPEKTNIFSMRAIKEEEVLRQGARLRGICRGKVGGSKSRRKSPEEPSRSRSRENIIELVQKKCWGGEW